MTAAVNADSPSAAISSIGTLVPLTQPAQIGMLLALLAGSALLLSSGAGCSSVPSEPPPILDDDNPRALEVATAHQAGREVAPRVPYRVGVLPLMVDEALKTQVRDQRDSPDAVRRRQRLIGEEDRRAYAPELVAAAGDLALFESITLIQREDADVADVLQDAWDNGIDLVLRPILTTHLTTYEGDNGAYIPSLLLWFLSVPGTTWWIADEEFGTVATIRLEVYATSQRGSDEALLSRETSSGPDGSDERLVYAFDDFDQGWNAFNIFITPGGLSDGHWNDVALALLPVARRLTQRNLLADWGSAAADGLGAALHEQRERLRKRMVLLLAAQPRDGAVRQFIDEDLDRLRDTFEDAWGFPEWMVATLDGTLATRLDLQATIENELRARLRPGDEATIVVLGEGVIDASTGAAHLLLADGDRATAGETGLSLDELGEWLGGIDGQLTIVSAVDWTRSDGAPLRQPIDEAESREWTAARWAPVLAVPGVSVLAATRAGQSLLEIEQLEGSLFVDRWIDAMRRAREIDTNGDGALSWAEILAAMERPVRVYSRIEGVPQTPTWLGTDENAAVARFLIPDRMRAAVPADSEGDEEGGTESEAGPATDPEGTDGAGDLGPPVDSTDTGMGDRAPTS